MDGKVRAQARVEGPPTKPGASQNLRVRILDGEHAGGVWCLDRFQYPFVGMEVTVSFWPEDQFATLVETSDV